MRSQATTRPVGPAGRPHQADLLDAMQYLWVKTGVGVLLATNFCVPLVTVVSNRHLWEEPMAVLAGNMSLTSTLMGIVHALVGIYDLIGFKNFPLCRFLQFISFGVAIAFKVAQVGAAVDQFVAIVYPLRHYPIMMRALPWLLAATGLICAAQIIFGIVTYILDLDTFSEHIDPQGNNTAFTGCRWETALANVHTIVAELELLTFSLVTASLLIYTGVLGCRTKARLMKEERQRYRAGIRGISNNRTFFENYRAFKMILIVLSLTVSLDIVTPILRIYSRWYPQPRLNGLMHQLRLFGFIFEGWTYGLLNAKLRAAYKKTFCGRSRRVESVVIEQNPPPRRRIASRTAATATAAAAAAATVNAAATATATATTAATTAAAATATVATAAVTATATAATATATITATTATTAITAAHLELCSVGSEEDEGCY